MITVAPADIDFSISNANVSPTNLRLNDLISFDGTIVNSGTTPAPDAFVEVFASLDGTLDIHEDVHITSIYVFSPGANGIEKPFNESDYLPAMDTGTYNLFFVVDGFDYVIETDEDNNIFNAGTIHVSESEVDLLITGESVSPRDFNY